MADNDTPLGFPGGGSGSKSATAATFQVNDASLKSMHKTWQLLTQDVGKFNAALIALDKGSASLDSIKAKLDSLGIGTGGGTGSGSGGRLSAGQTTKVQTPGRQPGESTTTQSQTSAQLGVTGGFFNGVRNVVTSKPFLGAVGAAYALGGVYGKRMGDMSDMDLAFTQSTLSGGGFTSARYSQNQSFVRGVGGYQSASDLTNAMGIAQRTFGASIGNSRTNQYYQQIAQLSALNPAAGAAGALSAGGALYNPAVQSRLRSIGIQRGPTGGMPKTPQEIYRAIQNLVFRGQKITPEMIGEGMQPGAPLYRTLVGLGLDQDTMDQFQMYALTQVALGGDAKRTDQAISDAAQGKRTADTRRAGLDSIRSAQNRQGMASTNVTMGLANDGRDALIDSMHKLAGATDNLFHTFQNFNGVLHQANLLAVAGTLPGSAGGATGALEKVGGGLFNFGTIKGLWEGKGIKGRIKGGLKGGIGMSGIEGTPVYVTNMPNGGFGGGGGGGIGQDIANEVENKVGGKLLGKLASRGGRLGKLGRLLGGTAEGAEAAEGVGAVGAAGAEGISGLAAAGFAAVPFVAAAGVGVALGEAAKFGIHHGWLGAPSDKDIKKMNDYANDNSVIDALHKLTSDGLLSDPAAKADWDSVYSKKLSAAIAKRDNKASLKVINDFRSKWQSKVAAYNQGRGLTDSGRTMMGIGTTITGAGSYATSSPGGALTGDGGANAAPSTKPTAASSTVSGIISTAESFLGKPYHWGGASPKTSFDCSGLMQWSFGQHGVKLPRTAAQQQGVGTDVPLDQLVPGDLVFYGSPAHHVAMYLGNGMMIEAPHTGANIRNTKLRTPTNAKRVVGGGAGVSGTYTDTSGSSNSPQGDSGTGPRTTGSANLRPGGGSADSELSALSNLLSGIPNLPGSSSSPTASGTTSSKATGGATATGSGNAPAGPMPKGSVGTWVKQALGIMHLDFDKYGPGIAALIQHESGGNPHAENDWDSNAKAGHPSKGLMQTIDSTFKQYALPGHGDIWNPVDNIIAGTRYALSRYGDKMLIGGGRHDASGHYKGYYQGSMRTTEGPAYLHDDEMVVPARTARKIRESLRRRGQQVQGVVPAQGGSRTVTVTIHAPVTVVGRATTQDAKDFLRMVKHEMENDRELSMVGEG